MIFTICSLYAHFMFTICSLHVHYMFTVCSLYVHMDREVAKARRRVNNQLMYCYFKMHLLQFMLFNEYI